MDNCYLTGQPVLNAPKDDNIILSYQTTVDDATYTINLCRHCLDQHIKNKKDFPKYYPVIQSMLANGVFGNTNEKTFHWNRDDVAADAPDKAIILENELTSGIYPRTPKEKIDGLLYELYQIPAYSGEFATFDDIGLKMLWRKWYFVNQDEFRFYVNALADQNLIYLDAVSDFFSSSFRFTYPGLTKYIELFNEGYASNICFIAMAFGPETILIRQAIKEAILKTGYVPHIIDEQNLPSDKTINDEIIAGLRKCKFCIADFSYHRNGVYFEAGFALGQKKPVIYSCLKDEFAKAHFDIKPLQHIIYDTPDELRDKLISKIQAWID